MVWRRCREELLEDCIEEVDGYGGGSIMVWAGISTNSKTDVKIIHGGFLTAVRYTVEILEQKLCNMLPGLEMTSFLYKITQHQVLR